MIANASPIPDHIGARPDDLSRYPGLIAFDRTAESELDPVLASRAVLAFGIRLHSSFR